MKRLFLTGIKRVLNEEAQKRLDAFEDEDDYAEPTDENGRNAEWYQDLGLPVPDSLKRSAQEYLQFDLEKDYDEYEVDITISMKNFVMAVDHEEYGSTVYLSNGNNVEVIEDNSDINAQIWWNSRSKWEIFKENVQNKYKKVINRLSTHKLKTK